MSNTSPPAGYSGTPLAKKIGIKPSHKVRLVNEPDNFVELLEPLPDDVEFLERAGERADVTIVFTLREADLVAQFARIAPRIVDKEMLWIGWPKKTSGVPSDLDENVVRRVGLDAGLVDVKVCAIDATWSGLKFLRRVKDRKK